MPSFGLVNANVLSEDRRARWLIENAPLKLQIAKVWPFLGIAGDALMVSRNNTALAAPGVASGCSTIALITDTVASVAFPTLDFITRYQVCFRDMDLFNEPNDLDESEYALAIRRVVFGFFSLLDAPALSGGLLDYVGATQKITMGGGALTLDCMDHAYQLVTANEGRPNIIMVSSRGLRAYQKLCRDKGYDAPKMPWSWYNPATGRMDSGMVTEFNGTPMLVNGLMASEASALAAVQRMWFMVLGDDGGSGPTRGVTGIIPSARVGNMFVRRYSDGTINTGETELQPRRDVFVTFPAGLAVASQGALSLIQNFTVPADCTVG